MRAVPELHTEGDHWSHWAQLCKPFPEPRAAPNSLSGLIFSITLPKLNHIRAVFVFLFGPHSSTLAHSRYSNVSVDLKPQILIGLNQYCSSQGVEREKEPPAGTLSCSAWPWLNADPQGSLHEPVKYYCTNPAGTQLESPWPRRAQPGHIGACPSCRRSSPVTVSGNIPFDNKQSEHTVYYSNQDTWESELEIVLGPFQISGQDGHRGNRFCSVVKPSSRTDKTESSEHNDLLNTK